MGTFVRAEAWEDGGVGTGSPQEPGKGFRLSYFMCDQGKSLNHPVPQFLHQLNEEVILIPNS